jgi:GNAT superfamily N-acetyltransferase
MAINIDTLKLQDIPLLTSARSFLNWNTPESYFQDLLSEQDKDRRIVLVAYSDDDIAGYVTIRWQSDYPPFAEKTIPEINDLRVLPEFRRCGVATALIDEAEKRIFKVSSMAGISVGLYADYGPAQRMYILRGYVPDGLGIQYKNQTVKPGRDVFVDDDLLLYFIKERK